MFNFVVIDTEDDGCIVDRFATWDGARHAYPDYERFKITRWSDTELAEREPDSDPD